MREIKFRAWNSQSKSMLKDVSTHYGIDDLNREFSMAEELHLNYMQYTGLNDEDGKEIYEDDVLANDSDATVIVKWNEKYACFTAVDVHSGKDYGLLGNCEPEKYKIIGSAYDNKDLLK